MFMSLAAQDPGGDDPLQSAPGWGVSVQSGGQPLPPPAGQGYSQQVLLQDGQPPGKTVSVATTFSY